MRMKMAATKASLLLLALVIMLSGCGGGNNAAKPTATSSSGETTNNGGEGGKLTDKDVEFTMAFNENPLQPIKPDSPTLEEIYKKTGVRIKPVIIPGADYATKMNTLLGGGQLPDFFLIWSTPIEIYDTGALLPMKELIENNAPTLKNYYDTIENLDRTMIMDDIYTLPMIRTDTNYEKGTLPIIRVDLLEEQNLEKPTTWDELYDVLLKLRDAYPDSVPYGARGDNRLLVDVLSPLLSLSGAHYDLYPDDTGTWKLGRTQETYKQALEFYNKLYKNRILDNEYLVVDTQSWLEGLSSGKYLFFYDNPVFIDQVNNPLKQIQPEARFEPLPILENSNGDRQNYKQPDHYFNYYGINSQIKDPQLAIKFWDWLYSEEGMRTLNYGVEGVHYELDADGNPQWTEAVKEKYLKVDNSFYTLQSDIGVGNLFFAPSWVSTAADLFRAPAEDSISPAYVHEMYKDDPAIVSIPQLPPFSQEEGQQIKEIYQSINDYSLVELNKFLSGARPLDEFGTFAQDVMKRGGTELERIANEAESRFQAGK